MTEWTDLVDKHTQTRVCKPVSEHGCGKRLPLKDEKGRDTFPIQYRTDEYGRRRRSTSSWCRKCRSRRNALLNAANKERVKHTGPQGEWRVFLCELPYTPLSKELRELR